MHCLVRPRAQLPAGVCALTFVLRVQVDTPDPADVRTLGRLFAELRVADALQPLFRAGQPQLLRHVAEEICSYLDTLKVRL